MSQKFEYPCGCSFPLEKKDGTYQISFNPKIENMSLECPRTWEIISDGNTKGCFQLESRLGRSMAKKLKPENIEQLSALISIMRPGCISGDTKIFIKKYLHTDGKYRFHKAKISEIVKNKDKYKELLSYDEKSGKFIQNTIVDAFYSGHKECFRVVIRTNERKKSDYGSKEYKLECTSDHKLLTPDGWKELADIKIGDRVLVNERKGTKIPGFGNKSFRQRCYNTYKEKCIFCDWKRGSLDVNHIIGNRFKNNDPNNLCYMCPNHHREFTEGNISVEEVRTKQAEHKLPITVDGKWCKLVDKISVGPKDVYDISMSAPYHNFIAGGVIVHNCLEAIRDGKTVSNHYIDKKNGLESVDYFHECLEPILGNTYGEMVYQEQAMEITKVVAGFDLQEADMLRKAIGKKKPEEMAKVKTKFLEGAKKLNIVTVDEAEQIFGWIEKSQRYSFNKSHSVSYAINAYLSAYTKAHFPKIFFASYLRFAKDKIDPQAEIKELVQNAHEMDIDVHTPDIRNLNEFFVLKNNKIYFGLTDIKGVGKSVFDKLRGICKEINWETITWPELLLNILMNINSTASKALIQSGAIKFIKKTRNSMLYEYNLISGLTKKELEHITNVSHSIKSLKDGLELLLTMPRVNQKRKALIQDLINSYVNPPHSLEDSAEWLADCEDTLLGCAITCSKIDMYDISMTNINCREFKNTPVRENLILGGEIDFISVTKTKNGKNPGAEMAFVTLTDSYGSVDSIVFFPEQYKEYKNILFPNNIIIVKGNKSKSGDGLIVEKAYIAKT